MSIRAIDWAFRQKTGSAASKLVLIKLADNANDEGRCYPSLAYIAEHCDMHRATVIRHIRSLAELGLVEVEHRSVEGSKIPNIYHLKMLQVVAGCDQGSRTLQLGVVAGCDQGSRTLQHRTVIEPSVKPSIEPRDKTLGDLSIADSDEFRAFWSAYPRKKNRAAAIKAFRHIGPELLPTLFADIEARIKAGEWRLDQPEYIPHPATYLNGKRWTDEITPRGASNEASRPNRRETPLESGMRQHTELLKRIADGTVGEWIADGDDEPIEPWTGSRIEH